MKLPILLLLSILFIAGINSRSVKRRQAGFKVKLCVPRKFLPECHKLYGTSDDANIKCIPARDRMECLELIKRRDADLMAVDPEDMYVAYHLENEDFDIIQEIRTVEEAHSAFRYDGIILVKKGSDIQTLKDLKGKKSCHTGFGRNVGYKIPLTKLRKNQVLKLSDDPELSSTEKELDALSLFFEKSCIAGKWSPDDLVNQVLKKRYSNLCALCEDPAKCDYPDKYSGYDGAVRCLMDGRGDVAFTKTYFVKKLFGLPIVAGEQTTPSSEVQNYEYLCENGTRTAITDPNPCSWAQRPWQGYMSNADSVSKKTDIQNYLKEYFNKGKTELTKDEAAHLFIKDTLTIYDNPEIIYPGQHLFKAQYKDVIERDGTEQGVIRFCVTSETALRKCKWLKRAAYSRDIRPQLECQQKGLEECIKGVSNGKSDAVVLSGDQNKNAQENGLLQILTEVYSEDNLFVGLVEPDITYDQIQTGSVNFDSTNPRAITSVLYLNSKRNLKKCPRDLSSYDDAHIRIINTKNLDSYKNTNKKLLCSDLSKKDLTEYKSCNLDYTLPNGIYVNKAESRQIKDNIKHAFTAMSKSFGPNGKFNDVFDLFGDFEQGQRDVIFSGDAVNILPDAPQKIDKVLYNTMHCY